MIYPKNLAAIKKWFIDHRPDTNIHAIDEVLKQDAFILMATAAFEAGRQFERDHPEVKGPRGYLP